MGKFSGVLIASDYDNTMVYTEGALKSGGPLPSVSRENREAVEYFMAEGGTFSVATGRALPSFSRVREGVPMNGPTVLFNGAAIYDFPAGRYLRTAFLPECIRDHVRQLSQLMPGLTFEIYHDDNSIHVVNPNEITARHLHLTHTPSQQIASLDQAPSPISKLLFEEEPQRLRQLEEAIRAQDWSREYEVVASAVNLLEITARGANKGGMVRRLAELLGIRKLWVKDDGQNPTASLKDRASAMAVAKAYEAGARTIACSSTGNAASSLAGNAAAAGFKTYIFVPERAPKGKVAQLMIFGANVISVKGNYEETFKMSAQAIEKYGWYNRNAAINPYLSEGKKTVALEIAEQLNWEMPDYLAISVGDGCTIAGVWKGFKDLYAIGFIDKLPRLISAQSYGCYPINRAIQENKPWEPMEENTIADSISVGVPRNADKALAAIRESKGLAICVTDEEILAAQRLLGRTCGVFGEPAGVTGAAALKKACEQGLIEKDATVVSVVTGNGLKDVANAIKSAGEPLHIEPDLDLMVKSFAQRGVTVE